MNIFNRTILSRNIIVLAFMAQLLTACVPGGNALFNSGIAKEWANDKPITREQLIMEPSYYFHQLDRDLDRAAWIMIPKGKLLQNASVRAEFTQLHQLLQSYILVLDKLPNSQDLPERQLAGIYSELLSDFADYLGNKKSMRDINAQLDSIGPRVRYLELALEDADSRRLSTMVQTISGNTL